MDIIEIRDNVEHDCVYGYFVVNDYSKTKDIINEVKTFKEIYYENNNEYPDVSELVEHIDEEYNSAIEGFVCKEDSYYSVEF